MIRVTFVCTANISRSPYAQVRMSEIFGDQVRAASAGIPGTAGRPMDPAMEVLLPYEDDEALSHRSRPLTSEILDTSDLVLTMEFAHHMRILDRWPDAARRVFGLGSCRWPGAGAASGAEARSHPRDPGSMMWDGRPHRQVRATGMRDPAGPRLRLGIRLVHQD